MRQIRPITVAGVQSIHRVDGLPPFDLCFVDEAHLIPKDGDGQYRTLIAKLRAINPQTKLVGLTATPYRLSGGRLTRGEGKVFSSICYELPVQQLVDEGHLSPLVSPVGASSVPTFSTAGVATRGGDFAPGELAAKIEGQEAVTRAALDEAAKLAKDRGHWLVYCASREHARQASEHLFSLGVSAHVVTGEDDPIARSWKIEGFKRGEFRALVSVDVLTTGFDAPLVDCIVLLRPTQSTGLYVQICGRGMRLSPGKTDTIVLDYGQNIERHGPITCVSPKEAKESLPVGVKVCPNCDAEVPVHRRECGECGFEFPRMQREVEHAKHADTRQIMAPPPPPEWVETHAMVLEAWTSKDHEKPRSVIVKYLTGNLAKRDYREWICPEHGGYAAEKFLRWWHKAGGQKPYPRGVDETVERAHELREPEAIVVEKDGRYDRVKEIRWRPIREPGDEPADEEPIEADDVALLDDEALPF